MNIQSLLLELKIPFKRAGEHRHAHTGWVNVDCPFCSKNSQKFRLGINLSKGYTSCWNCGWHKLSNVISEITGLSIGESYELINKVGWRSEKRSTTSELRKLVVPEGVQPMLAAHKKYLESRGLDPEYVAKVWGVQGIGVENTRLRWSLFIPICLTVDSMASWMTRYIGDRSPKYVRAKTTEELMSPKEMLYGEHLAGQPIVVCYSSDTEILTTQGWISFPNLTTNHVVAQYINTDGRKKPGLIEFVKPSAVQKVYYKGLMCNWKSDSLDILVTPDHRMLVKRNKCFPKIIRADEHKVGQGVPTSGILVDNPTSGNNGLDPKQARLLTAFLGSGHWEKHGGKLKWSLVKEKKKERLRSLLMDLDIEFSEHERSYPGLVDFRVRKQHVPFIEKYGMDGRWPLDCLFWKLETREAMIEEMLLWDGDRSSDNHGRFFSSSEHNADVVSALATITGYSSIVTKYIRAGKENKPEYTVNVSKKFWRNFSKKQNIKVSYDGYVYCCTVPSGFVVVRRNGRVYIAGNCEGPVDAWTIGPGAVSLLGLNYSRTQLLKIAKHPMRTICLDSESKAQKVARKLVSELSSYPGETYLVELETGKDPNEADPKEIRELRKKFLDS